MDNLTPDHAAYCKDLWDKRFRAFDESGKQSWETALPNRAPAQTR